MGSTETLQIFYSPGYPTLASELGGLIKEETIIPNYELIELLILPTVGGALATDNSIILNRFPDKRRFKLLGESTAAKAINILNRTRGEINAFLAHLVPVISAKYPDYAFSSNEKVFDEAVADMNLAYGKLQQTGTRSEAYGWANLLRASASIVRLGIFGREALTSIADIDPGLIPVGIDFLFEPLNRFSGFDEEERIDAFMYEHPAYHQVVNEDTQEMRAKGTVLSGRLDYLKSTRQGAFVEKVEPETFIAERLQRF